MEQSHMIDELDKAISEELKLSFQKLRRAAAFDKELKKTIDATWNVYQRSIPEAN
jgi:hypothetical protein